MLKVTQLIGFGTRVTAPPITIINRGTVAYSGSALTTYNFTSYAIGTASATRRVIAIVVANNGSTTGRTLSSVTIGGVSATIDASTNISSGGSLAIGIASATVTSGTTATISAIFSGSMSEATCWAVAIDNMVSTAAYDTATNNSGSDPITMSIDWLADGYVVGAAAVNRASSYTITGLTERADGGGGTLTMGVGDTLPTSSATAQSLSFDTVTTGPRAAGVAASYR